MNKKTHENRKLDENTIIIRLFSVDEFVSSKNKRKKTQHRIETQKEKKYGGIKFH